MFINKTVKKSEKRFGWVSPFRPVMVKFYMNILIDLCVILLYMTQIHNIYIILDAILPLPGTLIVE